MSLALRMAAAMAGGGNGSSDPYFNNVSLLLHGDGTNGGTVFTDSSVNNFIPTVTPTIVTATDITPKWGTASIYGTTGWLTYPTNPAFVFNTEQFTIEGWLYVTSYAAYNIIFNSAWNANGLQLYVSNNGYFRVESAVGSTELTHSAVILNQWRHFALQKTATNLQFFYNGVRTYDAASAVSYSGANTVYIGKDMGSVKLNAYLDDFRITKGVARYSGATITPPIAVFPNS